MKKTITFILVLFSWQLTYAQVIDSVNQEVSPKGGINQLAIKYYGINFTKDQRKRIENIEIEFIYFIDEVGNPTLSEINGVTDSDIVDSLRNKTAELERFNPRIKDGIPETSIYFMKLTFPAYKFTKRTYGLLQGSAYREAKLEDFEYINESGQRFDIVIGGFLNQFLGNPSKYLSTGGGMRADINYSGKNRIIYGLNLSFAENGLRLDYPINSTRKQASPTSGFVGCSIGKWFNNFNIQGEISAAVHNLTEKIGDNDPDWVQLQGWSPGIIINYTILLGKQNPLYYYGTPSLLENNLDLHFGVRYVKYSLKEASGLMTELGVSYRMTVKRVEAYKFKDIFLNK